MLDELDLRILRILQNNARAKLADIARELGKPRTTIMQRMTRLKRLGVINSYRAILDPSKIGYKYSAIIMVKVRRGTRTLMSQVEIAKRIVKECSTRKDLPFVEEANIVTGAYDIALKVWVREWKDLSKFLLNYLSMIEEVASTETLMVLEKVPSVPLPFPLYMSKSEQRQKQSKISSYDQLHTEGLNDE